MDIITLAMSKKSGGGITPEQLAQIEQNKNDISRLSEEKVDQTQLTNAVNDALTEAKESGEFDGAKGEKGDTGEKGADGTSVTISSVSESTEDGGSNIVTFSDGTKLTVKNGSKGSQGEKGEQGEQGIQGIQGEKGDKGDKGDTGATGENGQDYVLTDADKEEIAKIVEDNVSVNIETAVENEKGNIVQLIIDELQGLPVFGVVDNNNNITVTSQLSSGTYTLKYENEDGTLMDVGTITIDGGAIVIVNLLESAVGAQGTVLNDVGYADGYYLSGNANVSGNNSYLSSDASHFATGFIPYTKAQAQAGVPIYVKNITLDTTQSHTRMGAYPSYDYATYLDPVKFSAGESYITVEQLGDNYYKITPTTSFISTVAIDFNYIRFSFSGSGSGVIITVDQPIS